MARQMVVMEVSGEKQVIGSFNDRNEWITKKLDTVIRDSAHRIYLNAVENVPVSSGRLISSVVESVTMAKYKSLNASVRAQARYGTFVEFGTGPLGASTNSSDRPGWHHYKPQASFPNVAKIATWVSQHMIATAGQTREYGGRKRMKKWAMGTAFLIARAIFRRGGLPARPFLYPAFADERETFVENVKTALAIEET